MSAPLAVVSAPGRPLEAVLSDLEAQAQHLSVERLPQFLGSLARVAATAQQRLLLPSLSLPAEGEDRLLKAEEAATRLGTTRDYLYRNAGKLPFTVRLGPGQLRFSERGIQKFIRSRQGRP
jgi:predicted DNA-binding transcriptional regulator AlpA